MISAGDFRNGITLEIEGQVVQVIEFQHVKPGKGAAFVRTKLKNVISGGVVEKTFRPTEKFPAARIDRLDMQYLYKDGEDLVFMNNETFEQVTIAPDQVNGVKFMKEGQNVEVVVDASTETVLYVDVPAKVHLQVVWTEPGLKGDTATNTLKPAKVETGAEIRVPLFIEEGEIVEVDTRDGSYLGRVK